MPLVTLTSDFILAAFVCFSSSFPSFHYSTIYTGGVDALVRIHESGDRMVEPGFLDEHREEITCLDCSVSMRA